MKNMNNSNLIFLEIVHETELTVELSEGPKGNNKKNFLCILQYFAKQNCASFGK